MNKVAVLFTVSLFCAVGCVSAGQFKISMSEVDNGSKTVAASSPIYEDQNLKIEWTIPQSSDCVGFKLENKSQKNLKIIWDEAAYIGTSGESQRVMHNGVKFIDRNNPQPPTVVIKNSHVTDAVTPTDNVYWAQHGWETRPMFNGMASNNSDFEAIKKTYVGKTFKVTLPIEIDSKKTEYVYSFKITDFVYTPIEASKPSGSEYNRR